MTDSAPFIEIRHKRAKDLTSTDVVRVRLDPADMAAQWTEVLDVYIADEGLDLLAAQYDGIPEDAQTHAKYLDSEALFVMVRVMKPWQCSGRIDYTFLGYYGFALVEVQSEPAFALPQTGDSAH